MTGTGLFDAEFLRIKGQAILLINNRQKNEAADLFRCAIQKALASGTLLWALRSACQLIRIKPSEKKILGTILAEIPQQESFPELLEARKLMLYN